MGAQSNGEEVMWTNQWGTNQWGQTEVTRI